MYAIYLLKNEFYCRFNFFLSRKYSNFNCQIVLFFQTQTYKISHKFIIFAILYGNDFGAPKNLAPVDPFDAVLDIIS